MSFNKRTRQDKERKLRGATGAAAAFAIAAALCVFIALFAAGCSKKSGSENGRTAIATDMPSEAVKSPSEATETGGGIEYTPAGETPELTPSEAPTVTPTPEPTETPTPVPTELPPTATPTPEPTQEPTAEPTLPPPTSTATATPTPTEVPRTPTPERPVAPDPTPYVTPGDDSTFDIVISMVGDCMLASYKNEDAENGFKEHANREDPKYFLDKVAHIFKSDDLTIANLECVLTDKDLPPIEKKSNPAYWYYGKTDNVRILTEQGVEAVSLANNHMDDYGIEGRTDTIETVKNAGLLYACWEETFYYEKNGFKIAVICANLYSRSDGNEIVNLVKEQSKVSDFQIVFFHGGKMKIHDPEEWKMEAAHKIVDAGADLIVGCHPHMLQPREIYKGVDIVYSLGNFCYGGSRRPENRTVIYQETLTVNVADGKLVSTFSEFIPCYVYTAGVNNFQPAPITDPAERQRVLDFMNWKSIDPL